MKRLLSVAYLLALGACGELPPESTNQSRPDAGILDASTDAADKPTDPVQCAAGGWYTCACDNGNTGIQFCAWSGDAFSECQLCGPGSEPRVEPANPTDCNTNPKTWLGEVYKDCPISKTCMSWTCWDRKCVLAPAIPSARLVDEVKNDCSVMVCDGFGNAVAAPDPSDCDGGTCNALGVCAP